MNNSNYTNNSRTNSNDYSTYNYIYGVEFIIGTILNSFTIIVCMRKTLRKIPSFVIVTWIAIANLVILITTSMPNFVQQLTSSNWNNNNLPWCKVSFFFQIFSYSWSAWLLVKTKTKIITLNIINSLLFIYFLLRYIFQLKFILDLR